MLFSGGSSGTKGTPPKEPRKEKKLDKDEKYEIQETVFLRWINAVINEDETNIQELKEIAELKNLSKFALLILGVPVAHGGKNDADDIDAIFHAMVPDDPDDKLLQISVNELLSGQQKPLLAMCWQLIQIYWAKYAPSPSNERKLTEALKEWCLEASSTHPEVVINDFTSSFRDGIAINILIKSFDDCLVDLSEISELKGEDRLENALSLANRHFRVPRLLAAKEFFSEHLDMKSVACYLMMLYLGMCESASKPKASPRRRSTAPASVSSPPQQHTKVVPSTIQRHPSIEQQQQQKQSRQHSLSSAPARTSVVQVTAVQVPASIVLPPSAAQPQQQFTPAQELPRIITAEQHQQQQLARSLPGTPPPLTATPPRVVQTHLLTPPPVSQSPKAYSHILAAGTSVISPLVHQSHTSAQLMQHQQQMEAQAQAQQAQLIASLQQQQASGSQPGEQGQPVQQIQQQQILQQFGIGQPTGQQPQLSQVQTLLQPQQQQQYFIGPQILTSQAGGQMPPPPGQPIPQQQHFAHPQQMTVQQMSAPGQLQFVPVPPLPQHSPTALPLQPIPQHPAAAANLAPLSRPSGIEPPHSKQLSPPIVSLPQFTLPHQNQNPNDGTAEGMRSRKSSSSSQSKSRRRITGEMLQEYEQRLEEMLNWLNEAEQGLDATKTARELASDNLDEAKEKFRKHEEYMESLTHSQEDVGRELHRGYVLTQRTEGEQSTAIHAKLQSVNSRWQRIQEKAMQRQSALLAEINRIQRKHLDQLIGWLDNADLKVKELEPLADNLESCELQQIKLEYLKIQMQEKQPEMEQLSSFVIISSGGGGGQSLEEKEREEANKEEPSNVQQLDTLLKQVAKRWAKLGDWAEQQEKVLDEMPKLLEQYNQCTAYMQKWLANRSDELGPLQSLDYLETGEQVQAHLDLLRSLQKSLESQQETFVRLSQICTELHSKFEKGNNPTAAHQVRDKLDEITQSWEHIETQLDEHSEMLIRSGKVKLATGSLEEREGEQEQQQKQKRSVLETILSVDEGRGGEETQQSSSSKKRKMLPEPMEYLAEEEPTSEKKEMRFSNVFITPPTPNEKERGGEEERGLTTAAEQGEQQNVSPDERMAGESPPLAEEQKETEKRSSSDGELSSPTRGQQEPQQMVAQFLDKLRTMDRNLQPLVEWAQSVDVQKPAAPANVRQMVLICQKRLNEVREMEPTVTKLQIQLEYIHNRLNMGASQLHSINEKYDSFMSRWDRVVNIISKVLNNLSKPEPLLAKKETAVMKSTASTAAGAGKANRVALMVDQLLQWLHASQRYLDGLPVELAADDRMRKIAQIARQLSEQQSQLSHVKRVAKLSPEDEKLLFGLEQEMVALLRKIDQMRRDGKPQGLQREESLPSRLSPSTTTVQMKKDDSVPPPGQLTPPPMASTSAHLIAVADDFSPPPVNEAESLRVKLLAEQEELAKSEQDKMAGQSAAMMPQGDDDWTKWLRDKEEQLNSGQHCIVPGDLRELAAELEQCDDLITELRHNLREASSGSDTGLLMRLVGPIEQLLKAAEKRRNHCVDSINKTQLAIHKAVKVEEVGDKFKRELDWLRRKLADWPLKEADSRLKQLQETLKAEDVAKMEAIQLLEEVAQISALNSADINSRVAEQMRQRSDKLDDQFKELDEQIQELYSCCAIERQRRAESWFDYSRLLVEELEFALKASFESATDAEELSEHLDNLERFLDKQNQLEQESEEEGHLALLQSQSTNQNALGERIATVKERTEALTRVTQERCAQLRNAISRCEHFEQQLCQMQNWCTNMHQVLNQRLASDTYALDVPHEYKEAQRNGNLFKQIDKEFADYDELVAELEDYIGQSKTEFASTERLRLQLDHANEQLRQLRAKYSEFKQPIGLFQRMDQIEKQLTEIETSMDDLTGIQAENCEFCLLHAEQMQKELATLGTECAACEAGRDTLIRERILEETQAIQITGKLAQLTAKCVDELEPRARAVVTRLKRAMELLEKLERENGVLDKLLGEVEHRLDGELEQTMMDGKPTQRSVKALDEITRQLRAAADSAAKSRELESLMRQLSIQLPDETLGNITKAEERCGKLKDRLTKWSENIQELAEQNSQTGDSETDEEKMLAKVGQLGAELERQLGELEEGLENEKLDRNQLKDQLNEIRPLKERYERRALQMLTKGDFNKRIGPTLADMTSRWRKVGQKLAEMEKEEEERGKRKKAEEMMKREQEERQKEQEKRQQKQAIQQLEMPSIVEPLAKVVPEPVTEMSDFSQQVQAMIDAFEKARDLLDFPRFPLRAMPEWDQRLSDLNNFVSARKLRFDELIAEGKRVAEVGPMELATSAALARLDRLIELVHELDEQAEREEQRMHAVKAQIGRWKDQIGLTRERIAVLAERTAALDGRAVDPTPIITLQQELMDASGQLQLLRLSADEVRKSMPPALYEERLGGDVLEQLNRQLHEIEARLQEALLRALQSQPEEEEEKEEEEGDDAFVTAAMEADEELAKAAVTAKPAGPQTAEPSSAAAAEQTNRLTAAGAESDDGTNTTGPLLEMDAAGTDEDEEVRAQQQASRARGTWEEEPLESTVTTLLPTTAKMHKGPAEELQPEMDELAGMDQFYVNLDTMEDYLEQPESLPYEALDEKADILKDFEMELQRGEELLAVRQMTMEVGECEHIQGRVGALRDQLAERAKRVERRRETVQTLEQLYGQCERLLDELAQRCRSPRHSPVSRRAAKSAGGAQEQPGPMADSPRRNGSPDLDELETSQAELEGQLPPIAVRLQQIQNRLNAIVAQLSAAAKDKFQQRIRLLVDDFNDCAKAVRGKRRALEERFADQTHLNQHLEELEFWCDETEAIVSSNETFGALNTAKLDQQTAQVRQRHEQADAKMDALRAVERLKDRFVNLASVEPQAKHEVRRAVAQLGKRISDLRMKLKEQMDALLEERLSAEELWREFAAMQQWVEDAERQCRAVENAKIYKPTLANIEQLASQTEENRLCIQSIQRRLLDECPPPSTANAQKQQQQMGPIAAADGAEKENLMRVEVLLFAFEKVAADIERTLEQRGTAASDDSSSADEQIENLYVKMDKAKQRLLSSRQSEQQPSEKIVGFRYDGGGGEQQQRGEPPTEYGTLSMHSGEESREEEEEQPQMLLVPMPIQQQQQQQMDTESMEGAEEHMMMDLGRYPRRRMSLGEQARLDTVTRLRSWLQEVERDVAVTVDLADQNLIRQAHGKMQNCVDEIQIHQLEIIRVLDEAKDRLIVERAQLCQIEMDRVLGVCKRRKGELQKILEQCHIWEKSRFSLDNWLNGVNERLMAGGRAVELSDPELGEQLDLCAQLAAEVEGWKGKLQDMNRVSNQLLDIHRRDDGHNLSHLTSKLNTQWTKFNDQLRIRRAVLEATQRSRHDFQTALGHFQQWMNKQSAELQKLEQETNNPQRVKDTGRRREWLAQENEARMEIDAHREMMESVKKMGRKLLDEQQLEMNSLGEELVAGSAASKAREQLRKRVEAVESEWQALLELSGIVRDRLESAQEECERLTQSLADFLYWTDQQLKTISDSKPVGGDLGSVQKQCEIARTIERTMEARERQVEECVRLSHTFLMQHDLRPALHTPALLADPSADLYSCKTEAEREERRVGVQILADSSRLQSQWARLKEELAQWSQQVASAYKEMHDLDRAMAEALLTIGTVEEEMHQMKPVEDLLLEELKAAREECAEFRHRVQTAGTNVDDVNDYASSIQAAGIQLTEQVDAQVRTVNERYEKLKKDIGCRGAALERAFNHFGPASEHYLVDVVELPWQRAISSTNRLPYYIDHSSERTQWDHPAMVDILEGLCAYNQVKFCAYRTAMKLRALQKRLCLDLIDLADLNTQYVKQLANYTDDQRIQVEDVIQCLLPLFEKAQQERPALVKNVSLAVDLTLNLLLNIYDPCRDGKMRVLSFKIALVVLCHDTLESKYTYLFHLISNKDGVDHKRLAVLFYDLIHIPKFLGEAAAFGGSNIEPSVRSCFEHAKFPPSINADQFLDWLKKEPQSLVWLPVMHRLASSEFAKHQAKCNACKMYPIVGLRYRCLRCFNFDICQNCFFSQRTSKSHKLSHPMQEYCIQTNTGDDVRDFTAIIKNKVRQGRERKGYLPVEQIDEGPPLECTDQTPQNADTEAMHQRMHLIASRLENRQTEATEMFPNGITAAEGKMNGHSAGSRKSVQISGGGLPAPIMLANGTESENGSAGQQQQRDGEQGDREEGQYDESPRMQRKMPVAHLQSPNMLVHERQRSNQVAGHEVKSPSQLVSQVDQASKEELDQLIYKLQYENMELKRAIEERRKAITSAASPMQNAAKSTPNLMSRAPQLGYGGRQTSEGIIIGGNGCVPEAAPSPPDPSGRARSIASMAAQSPPAVLPSLFSPHQQAMLPPPIARHNTAIGTTGQSMPGSLHRQHSLGATPSAAAISYPSAGTLPAYSSGGGGNIDQQMNDHQQQIAVLAEAQQLRLHQKRLEDRGRLLEEQNRQLQMQLDRLQRLMEKRGEMPFALQQPMFPTAPGLAGGFISSTDAEDTDIEMLGIRGDIRANSGLSTGQIGTEIRRNRMDRLKETVNELNRAMENFVLFTQTQAAHGVRRGEQDTDQDSGTADQDEGQVTDEQETVPQ